MGGVHSCAGGVMVEVEQAARRYECRSQASDAYRQSFERRAELCFLTNPQMSSGPISYDSTIRPSPKQSLPVCESSIVEVNAMESIACSTDYTAYVALDWADKKHAWALQEAGQKRMETGWLDNTPEAVEVWAMELARRFGERSIALAVEQPRGAVVAKLSKYAHLVIHPVPPSMLAHYRQTFCPSGAKSDPGDSRLLLELLTQHRDQLRTLRPDTPETRRLQLLSEARRKIVDDRTAGKNQLTNWLKQVFPQVLDWFDDIGMPLALGFLRRWPTLQSLGHKRKETLRRFFKQRNCRSRERIEQRLEAIATAVPATNDEMLLEAAIVVIRHLVVLVEQHNKTIADLDDRIAKAYRAHPDYPIAHSMPGIGPALGPRLIAAVGTDRDRFANATELQCYTGIAPVITRSGNQKWVHWRWACSKFLRQGFQEWAQHSIGFCGWAKEYYTRQKAKGKAHHAIVRALAFKWIRIYFRCWKDHQPYDDERYLAAITTPRPKPPDKPEGQSGSLAVQWETHAGFSKVNAISC